MVTSELFFVKNNSLEEIAEDDEGSDFFEDAEIKKEDEKQNITWDLFLRKNNPEVTNVSSM